MPTEHINVEALIQGIQLKDARLYQILQELNKGLLNVQEELFPLVFEAQRPPVVVPVLPPPTSFTFAFTPITVRLFCTEVLTAFGYEVRRGTVWETGSFVFRNNSLQADIDPLLIGTQDFMINTINVAGLYSETHTSLIITARELGRIALQSSIIDNNVLLRWDVPTSTFRILHYEAYRNGAFSGTVDSTFFSFFENVAAYYTYGIIAVDAAGNKSALAEVTVEVLTPPDFALQDTYTSQLLGPRVNVIRLPNTPSLLCCWTDQIWFDHFTVRSWTTIQQQIAAGYPIYIQPTVLTGSYEEVRDYGVVIQNTIATVTYNFNVYHPETAVIIRIATSEDGVNFTPFVAGSTIFAVSMRFMKVRLEFTNTSDQALFELYNLTFTLSVKRENDGGKVYAEYVNVNDPGTWVAFKKDFKDVESITCTTESAKEPFYAIFDFLDEPNPEGFRVYTFDSTGNRVKMWVDWKARGIV